MSKVKQYYTDEVEKKVDAWRKANPDKIFVPRGTRVLTMIVPEEVDEDWLESFYIKDRFIKFCITANSC